MKRNSFVILALFFINLSCVPFAINDKNCDYWCDDFPEFYTSEIYLHHAIIIKVSDKEQGTALSGLPVRIHKVKTDWNPCGKNDISISGDGTCRYFINSEEDFNRITDASGNVLVEFDGDYDHDQDHYEIAIFVNSTKDANHKNSYAQAEVNVKLEERKSTVVIPVKLLSNASL